MAEPVKTTLLAATVGRDGLGCVQMLAFHSHDYAGARVRLSNDARADSAYLEQVSLASKYLEILRQLPSWRSILGSDVDRCVCVTSEGESRLEGGSHGLSLLLGSIAHILGVRPRQDCIFAASLGQPAEKERRISLEPVTGVASKSLAASQRQVERLYYHRRVESGQAEEIKLRRYELAHWHGEGDHSCLPLALPRYLNWGNLVNLALEVNELCERLLQHEGVAYVNVLSAACELLMSALSQPAAMGEYPVGVGRTIAQLRSHDSCPSDLPEQLGFHHLIRRCPERYLPDIAKTAISDAPNRPIREDYAAFASNTNARAELNLQTMPLARSIILLDLGIGQSWLDQELVTRSLRLMRERIEQCTSQIRSGGLPAELFKACSALLQSGDLPIEIHATMIRLMGPVADFVSKEDREQLQGMLQALSRRILAPAHAAKDQDRKLTITFALPDQQDPDRCAECGRWPVVPVVNPLQVTYSATQDLDQTLPSPVLLCESSSGLGSFSKRIGFREADDTLARIPARDAAMIRYLFGEPTRIQFRLRRPGLTEEENVGVLWVPQQIPFPPAIDSQFLVAAVQRWLREQADETASITSMIDVGCGTGYLAAAAAYLLPDLKHITLIDYDQLTVMMAADNLHSAVQVPGSYPQQFQPVVGVPPDLWAGDFVRYPDGQHFDLLLCNPPYLPDLQLAGSSFERAINGTQLLQNVVSRAARMARYSMITFSKLAWYEFENALAKERDSFRRIVVYERQLVPLRITTIEPLLPEENNNVPDRSTAERQFTQRLDYYRSTLMRPGRGLIDLDDEHWRANMETHVQNSKVLVFAGTKYATELDDVSGMPPNRYREVFQELVRDSRGFRFWHEARVVLLESAVFGEGR